MSSQPSPSILAKKDLPTNTATDSTAILKWQRQLLPLMTRFIVVMAGLFFCFSAAHLVQVSRFIETDHARDIRNLIESQVAKPAGQVSSPEEVLQNSLLLLEADALDKRYHEASALLLSRIWNRQLAFITGMVMTFLGAIFILGKLSESSSNISGGSPQWQVGISSASPGIILSFLGTVLLAIALLVQTPLDVADGPAYVMALRRAAIPSVPAAAGETSDPSQPIDLDEFKKLGEKHPAAQPAPK